MHEYNIQINIIQIQTVCQQTKCRNILNWLSVRTIYHAQMRNFQNRKQQKREYTGSIVLILEMIIISIIIIQVNIS